MAMKILKDDGRKEQNRRGKRLSPLGSWKEEGGGTGVHAAQVWLPLELSSHQCSDMI